MGIRSTSRRSSLRGQRTGRLLSGILFILLACLFLLLLVRFVPRGFGIGARDAAVESHDDKGGDPPSLAIYDVALLSEEDYLICHVDGRLMHYRGVESQPVDVRAEGEPRTGPRRFHRVAASAGGSVLAVAESGPIVLWPRFDGPAARPILLGVCSDFPTDLAVSPDGCWGALATARSSQSFQFELWDLQNWSLAVRQKCEGMPESLAFSSDSTVLACAMHGQPALMNVTRKLAFEWPLPPNSPKVDCVAFSGDPPTLYLGHSDGTLSAWNASGHRMLWSRQTSEHGKMRSVWIGPQETTAVLGTAWGGLRLLDLRAGEIVAEVPPSGVQTRRLFATRDGELLMTAGYDGMIHRWKAGSLVEVFTERVEPRR